MTPLTIRQGFTDVEVEDVLRQLGLALEASGIGIWQHNITRNQTRWDDQLKAIYGVPKGPLDVVWLSSVHPDDVDPTNAVFEAAIAQRCDYASQFRIVRPNGEIRYLRSRARHFINTAGEPCFIGAEWDVTEDVLKNQQLEAEREAAEQSRAEARYAADHDYLTGLLNRRSFDQALLNLSLAPETTVSLCHIDVDHFKEINDRYGHVGGDRVLTHLSAILSSAIGADDLAVRLGGDEFAILLREDGSDKTETAITTIKSALAQPISIDGQALQIQCSIGIATTSSGQIDMLLSQSDLALYQAKKAGRNRSEVFTQALAADIAQERRLIYDLKAALAKGQIRPFYQVQIEARSGEICGLEALARWHHPSEGVLLPGAFLDAATQHGLVDAIDDAILAGVLNDIDQWKESGCCVPPVSVNLSASRLSDPLLVERIARLDIPAGALSFELVETIFFDRLADQIRQNIDGIRSLGIGIEIDDLGSGHASLIGLVELRPDRVKIDRHLISPVLESVPQRRLVRSLVEIARALDMRVVAEGVETTEHASVLTGLGVDIFQGYAFGRPEPAKAILQRLLPPASTTKANRPA